jgi:predicted  nucleic acid-binding Zn-ribbon protein
MDYLQKAEKALDYLAESEMEFADLKAQHQALKERLRTTKARLMVESNAKTQGQRENEAEASSDYLLAIDEWETTLANFYLIEAKRKRAELTIEMYRSVNSALKRGNI